MTEALSSAVDVGVWRGQYVSTESSEDDTGLSNANPSNMQYRAGTLDGRKIGHAGKATRVDAEG